MGAKQSQLANNNAATLVDTQNGLTEEMTEFVLYAISHVAIDEQEETGVNGRGDLWHRLPACFKQNRRVVTAGMVHRCCQFQDLPVEFQTDETFLLQCIKKQPECWRLLPDHFKCDVRFALAIDSLTQLEDEMFKDVLDRFSNDREFWKKHIANTHVCYSTLQTRADMSIRSDRDLMIAACVHEPYCLEEVDASLQGDMHFLDLLLQKQPAALMHLSHETQKQFPHLLTHHLRAYFLTRGGNQLFENIYPDFWSNRQHVLSWFLSGGCFVKSMPKAWRNDREIFLLLAEHSTVKNSYFIFKDASSSLFGDTEFAMRVLEYRPNLLFRFDDAVIRDVDIALLGCTGFTDFRNACERQERYSVSFPRNLADDTVKRVKALMSSRKSFETVLLGMSDEASGLSRLDLGHETSLSLKKLIADFVGDVPMGRKLRHVQAAARHLNIEYSCTFD